MSILYISSTMWRLDVRSCSACLAESKSNAGVSGEFSDTTVCVLVCVMSGCMC